MIGIETFDQKDGVVRFIADLRAPHYKLPSTAICDLVPGAPDTHYGKARNNKINYYNKSESWIVPADWEANMMNRLKTLKIGLGAKVKFNLFGKYNYLNFIAGMLDADVHSCVTWAIDTLKFSGICLDRNITTNSVTITTNILKEPALKLNIRDLFRFIVDDDVDSIQKFFPVKISFLNYLHENIMVGSIPGYLGHYSPLLLAASVGSYEIVKLLHSKYDADIHLLGGRYRDTTAIDCARHHFWLGISQERTNKKIDIIQYLQSHNAKTGNEQRKIVQNLCKAAY